MNDEEQHLSRFLDHLCVKQGYCLPPSVREDIASNGPYEPARLATLVLQAEGLDPEMHLKQLRDVRNAYVAFPRR